MIWYGIAFTGVGISYRTGKGCLNGTFHTGIPEHMGNNIVGIERRGTVEFFSSHLCNSGIPELLTWLTQREAKC